jgi:glucosamine--fructose-6-phosphate aminotransferase (isomerizing)
MCGIVGYVGHREATSIVISGLKRLEYRGYDSAGVAAIENGSNHPARLKIKRCEGKIENLVKSIEKDPISGSSAIGHTRWATHGRPSERNAHPHRFKDVVIVHNGIIENYADLKAQLQKKGHEFSSETDSEVIAHLLQVALDQTKNFESACQKMVSQLKGAFAITAVWIHQPKTLFVAKNQCPIVLGLGEHEKFVASDIPALLDYTREFIFLDDREMAFVQPEQVVVKSFSGAKVQKKSKKIEWSLAMAEKEGYPHFMLKEIHEQPRVIQDSLRGRILPKFDGVHFENVKWTAAQWKKFKALNLVACGTAWHASLLGKYWIEQFARIPVDVDLASEFRYRNPVVQKDSLCVAVSQSGETADTLAAITEGMRLKQSALAITNTVESSLARKAKNVIYTHAGPEISVASTKCFIAQLTALYLLGVHLAKVRGTQSQKWIKQALIDINSIPEKIEEVLKQNDRIQSIAKKYSNFGQYFYLGRGLSYPLALEGALKLKEIAYINTQAYSAGEMKHGPIALISEDWPVVCVAPQDGIHDKMISNIEEVKARGGRVIMIGTEGDSRAEALASEWISLPKVRSELYPFVASVVLQLYAYHMAVLRGTDVDKPKNLAKSVTVE